MQAKALKSTAAVFLILLALWAFIALRERTQEKTDRLWRDALYAEKLILDNTGTRTVLLKKDQGWRLEEPLSFPANPDAIKTLLERLAGAEFSAPVSDDPSRHSLYLLTSTSAIRLQGFSKHDSTVPQLDIYIGRAGADPNTFFSRQPESVSVHEVRDMGRHDVDKKFSYWADRVVCDISRERIFSLEIRSPHARTRWTHEGGEWRQDGKNAVLSPEAVNKELSEILLTLTRLEADSLALPESLHPFVRKGLQTPEKTLLIEYLGTDSQPTRQTLALEIGVTKPGFERPVKVSGREKIIYLVADWRLKAFFP